MEMLEAAPKHMIPVNPKKRLLDGAGETALTMLACLTPPPGHAIWSLKLLGERLVALEIVDVFSKDTARQTSEKSGLKAWVKTCRCIPLKVNVDFVYAMEDVLDIYSRDYHGGTVLVCVDETAKQQAK